VLPHGVLPHGVLPHGVLPCGVPPSRPPPWAAPLACVSFFSLTLSHTNGHALRRPSAPGAAWGTCSLAHFPLMESFVLGWPCARRSSSFRATWGSLPRGSPSPWPPASSRCAAVLV